MEHAIDHLKDITNKRMPGVPTIISLQKVSSCTLEITKGTSWVRDYFHLIDISPQAHWLRGHGTATLVDRRLPILSAWRVPDEKQTGQGRDASFVDLNLKHRVTKSPFRLRLCNTHLESFNYYMLRRQQLALVSEHLRADSIHAGAVAGDLNAYPCKRLDKILFCGNVIITDLKTFGRHLRTSEGKVFVSDHFGVMADLEII